jgi:hypothetical protein
METIKYYFIIGSENFLFKQEPLEEVLRERVQNYNMRKKLLNFWIVKNPAFLKDSEFIEMNSNLPKNRIAIISTQKTFITWLKLRLNNVVIGNFTMSRTKKISPLGSIPNI